MTTLYIVRRVQRHDDGTESYRYLCERSRQMATTSNINHPTLIWWRNRGAAEMVCVRMQHDERLLGTTGLWQVRTLNDEETFVDTLRNTPFYHPGYRGEHGYYEPPHDVEDTDDDEIPF